MNYKLDFTPSKYQEEIFNFIKHGLGNAVIQASAGSGKTTTIVAAMKMIPKKKKCLFIAFNKSIVKELQSRLIDYDNCTVKTVHSLGYSMLISNFKDDFNLDVDEYKYKNYLQNNICSISNLICDDISNGEIDNYIDNIIEIINYSRFNLAQSIKEIKNVADNYNIPCDNDECEVALKCLEWGKTNLNTVDYTDMVWLPYELSINPFNFRYDFIFLDEAQDFSNAYVQLFLRCFKRSTRFIAVGDEKQAINQFAGASVDAFNFMINYPKTTKFDLPISYRCDKKIIDMANDIIPGTLPRDNAPDGLIIRDCFSSIIKNGDMVLCRNKAPLVKLYIKLLNKKYKAYIKGEDIGIKLIDLLNSCEENELNVNLNSKGVFSELYDRLINERNKMMKQYNLSLFDAGLTNHVLKFYDNIITLQFLSQDINSKEILIKKLKEIFVDNYNDGICLSTIHKSKGLEANNVYIICESLLNTKSNSKQWEKIQERNLRYVAYTRAKHKLGFISEKEIHPVGAGNDENTIIKDMAFIEKKLSILYNKQLTPDIEKTELAKFKLRAATKINDIHENDNKIEIPTSYQCEDNSQIDFNAPDEELLKMLLK